SGVATSTTFVATRPSVRSLGCHVRAISAACSPQVSWKRVGTSVGGTVRSDASAAGRLPRGLQRLREVLDEVVDVLDTGRDADQPRRDPRCPQALLAELRVRGAGRVGDAGLRVAEVHQPRGELQRVEERLAGLDAAVELDVEHGAGAAREVALGDGVAGVVGQLGVDDVHDALLLREPLHEAARVRYVTLGAQAQGLEALQQEEGVERREALALVAQALDARAYREGDVPEGPVLAE